MTPRSAGPAGRRAATVRAVAFTGPLVAALLVGGLPHRAAAQEGARAHLLRVLDPAEQALPDVGFLTRALGEAGMANEYAGYAAGGALTPGELPSMRRHAAHVLHTLDPGRVAEGPGFGFGVIPSTRRLLHHIEGAAGAPDAGEGVRAHAGHVAHCARNALGWAERMVEVAEAIRSASTAEEAEPLADELELLSRRLRNGEDRDGDGRVGWREGGLYQARDHMLLLLTAEGMAAPSP